VVDLTSDTSSAMLIILNAVAVAVLMFCGR
jgi:hypothetical protein